MVIIYIDNIGRMYEFGIIIYGITLLILYVITWYGNQLEKYIIIGI